MANFNISSIQNEYSALGGKGKLLGGNGVITSAKSQNEMNKFQDLLDSIEGEISKEGKRTGDLSISSSMIAEDGKLNGDISSSMHNAFTSKNDKKATLSGAARNSHNGIIPNKTIDKTSKLYEKSLELESYFVKTMLSTMRNTVLKSNLTSKDNEYARNMYEDMMYDEYANIMTKNAGFGIADQIYLELSGNK